MARDTSPQCKQCRREGIKLFSVMTHAMPPNNITQMTAEERRKPELMNGSRRARVAKGAGIQPE